MAQELTDDETGVSVRTPDGDSVGTVARVEDGVAYVDPDDDAPETVLATLGWDDPDAADGVGAYPLPRTAIDAVDGEEIRLRRGDADADRIDGDDEHDPDADLARADATDETDAADREARERAQDEEARQDVEASEEREAAARESSNPDAHRDEEPFNS